MDLGKQIDSTVIQTGLRELNADINFDVVSRLSAWDYVMDMTPEKRTAVEMNRLPVCHLDRYICSLDRDMVTEFKMWELGTKHVEVPADSSGDFVNYERVAQPDRSYRDLADRLASGDKSCTLNTDGTITRYWQVVPVQVKTRVLRLGWRHTFENLIGADIPGVTRDSISKKFSVDMLKFPVGAPEEILAALKAE